MLVYAQELVPGRVGMIAGMFFGFSFGLGGLGAAIIAGDNATDADIELIRSTLGLDRPLIVQFLLWLGALLQGDLGAGKTTFVQGIAAGWGAQDEVSSPTFVLVNIYRGTESARLFHLDTYRIESAAEAEELDLEAMLAVCSRVGVLGKILRENPGLREAALPAVRSALAAHDGPDGVKLNAATWIVTARVPA